jgi:subtilase family serine protease
MNPNRRQFLISGVAVAGVAALGLRATTKAAAASLPDLIVTAVLAPAQQTVGDVMGFKATVKNQGAGSTPIGVELGVAFRIDGKEVCWSGKYHTALASGASIVLNSDSGGTHGNGTWVATLGKHTLEAVVNDVKRFPETNSSNNALSVLFIVGPPKPHNVSLPVISGTPTVGQTLSCSTGTWD